MPSLSISAFAADPGHTARDLRLVQDTGADALHIDVMDGHFVTLTGLGVSWLEAMRPQVSLPMDIHLMTLSPERFVPQFTRFGVSTMTIPVEGRNAGENAALLKSIRNTGIRAGLMLSPGTNPECLVPHYAELDEALVMSSLPGEQGSSYLPDSIARVRTVRNMLNASGSRARITVDGGLTPELAVKCIAAGADNVIMGRAFFSHDNPSAIVRSIHAADNSL